MNRAIMFYNSSTQVSGEPLASLIRFSPLADEQLTLGVRSAL